MSEEFNILVSDDRMTVTLTAPAGNNVDAAKVIAALRAMNLAAFDDGLVIEALEQKSAPVAVVVASGTPALDENQSPYEFRVPVADGTAATICRVEPRQVVATFTAGPAATDGRDVFGAVVPAKHRRTQLGKNLSAVGNEIVADIHGNLRLHCNCLSLEPLLEISDGLPLEPPAQFAGDVYVNGSLSKLKELKLAGQLTVTAAMEALHLTTGGSIHVGGGIIGKLGGHYVIGGDLRCRFITGGIFAVNGNLEAQSEISHACIMCAGRLSMVRGEIYGGEVSALAGIACRTLGHVTGVPTIIEAGPGTAARRSIAAEHARIFDNHKKVANVRKQIEPLLCIMKRLTAQQRERTTELLAEAGELESATRDMEAALKNRIDALQRDAVLEIAVSEVIHAGVTIRLGNVQTTIATAFKGPMLLTARKTGTATEIILQEADAQPIVLPSQRLSERLQPAVAGTEA